MLGESTIPLHHRAQHSALWLLDHCLGRAAVDRVLSPSRKRVHARIAADLQARGKGHIRPVDRRDDLSPHSFVEEYLRPNLPVVLAGAARDWACLDWTPDALADRYGDDPVVLIGANQEDIVDPDFTAGHTTIRGVADAIREGRADYARFNPLLQNHPELLEQLDVDWYAARTNRVHTGVSFQLFMGGRGTSTATHNAVTNNLFLQVHGTKRWLVFPPTYNAVFDPPLTRAPYFFSEIDPAAPDLDAFPLFEHVDGYEAVLEPGDILFNPSFYWHRVTNDTDTIGVGYRWFAPWNIARSSLTQFVLTALATNPSALTARRNRQDFARIFTLSKRV